jgi:hypothetical protein
LIARDNKINPPAEIDQTLETDVVSKDSLNPDPQEETETEKEDQSLTKILLDPEKSANPNGVTNLLTHLKTSMILMLPRGLPRT